VSAATVSESHAARRRLVRVAMVDDHPAMRVGIRTVLDAAPGIVFVGEAPDGRAMWPMLERTAPDVVLLDFHLPEEDGLVLCHRVKRCVPAPRVVIVSAYAGESMAAPAMLAQADGVLSKQASARALCDTLRRVVIESGDPPPLSPAARRALHEILEPGEMALAGLLLLGIPPREIARTLRMEPGALCARVEALLCRVGAALGLPQRAPTPGNRS
jgi:DNA-binding NarL/FixJ family response regulator